MYYTGQKDKARTVFKYLENHTSVGKNLELKKGSQSDVEKDKISANVSDGVLTIELPKSTPEEKAKVNRVIEIH